MKLEETECVAMDKCEVYLGTTDDETSDELRLSIVSPRVSVWFDMSVEELVSLKHAMNAFHERVFRENDDTARCPACGYTFRDSRLHGDHKTCRNYPFFPGERGKSDARP
jgi:hypothetical protein